MLAAPITVQVAGLVQVTGQGQGQLMAATFISIALPLILIVSMHADREYVREAFASGASGYLLKNAERSELEMALAVVARGEYWLSPAVANGVIVDVLGSGTAPDQKLTARQREVLQLVAEGHSTKDIARRLRLSVKTIETHRARIMERLDIHHVAGLVRYALRVGLVSEN